MKLCKHAQYKSISDILEPRYHDNHILISVAKVPENIPHFIIKFKKEVKKYPDWFYLSGKDIRNSKKQDNGRGEVYAVNLNKSQTFTPDKNCRCMNMELFND